MRLEPSGWIRAFMGRNHERACLLSFSLSALHHVRLQWEYSHVHARKRVLTKNPICWHLDLGLTAPGTRQHTPIV
jgi:hypothetical protein